MREIKFRSWVTSKVTNKSWMNHEIEFVGGKINDIFASSGSSFADITYMQYTGLKDKNQNPIYEGDVIQTNALRENEFRWLVEPIGSEHADGGRYGICVSYYGDGDNQYLDDGILAGEVIGNIYENPELLVESE